MSNVKGVKYSYAVSPDMAAATAFYADVLRLPVKFTDPGKWTQFQLPDGSSFAISSVEEAPAGAGGLVVVFEVDDIDAVRDALQSRGGEIESRDMGSHGRIVTARDPAGNIVQFFQKKSSK